MKQLSKLSMKSVLLSIILAAAVLPAAAQNIDDLFGSFARQTQHEYASFQQEANLQFVDILKESWVEFDSISSMDYPRKPKPKVAPIAPATPPIKRDSISDIQKYDDNPQIVRPNDIEDCEENSILDDIEQSKNICRYLFCNIPITIAVTEDLINYRMAGNKESDVAAFWAFLSSNKCEDITTYIIEWTNKHAVQMNLNDWGVYLWITTLSKNIFSEKLNEMEVFATFLLNQVGLDARLGLADGRLVTMVAVKEQVYARMYCEYNGCKYYFPSEIKNVKTLFSYKQNFPGMLSPVSVNITTPLNLGIGQNDIAYTAKKSSVFSSEFRIPINTNLCAFYKKFPQVDIDVYVRAAVDDNFSREILSAIKPHLENKSKEEQVSLLMRFMHYDFQYKTDDEQFGYEKPLFVEEDFVYAYNDCEDRSILLAYLVRELVGLDSVLVEYSDHVAVAICFDDDLIEKHFRYNGKNYTICDPTYIGASIGDIMEGYENAKFNVITY